MFSVRAWFSHKKSVGEPGDYLLAPHKKMLKGAMRGKPSFAIGFIACCAVSAVVLVVDVALVVKNFIVSLLNRSTSTEKGPEVTPLIQRSDPGGSDLVKSSAPASNNPVASKSEEKSSGGRPLVGGGEEEVPKGPGPGR